VSLSSNQLPRLGLTIPIDGVPLARQLRLLDELPDLGYTDAWSSESDNADGFTPLALAAARTDRMRLGTAIVSPYVRGPAVLAMSFAALANAAPGRVAAGIGSSSPVIVEDWNAAAFARPYQRVRDTVRFLRRVFSGERVTEKYETFAVNGFRLAQPPEQPPPILIAGLREGMLRLARDESDGAIINWLSAEDVRRVAGIVGPDREIVSRILVCPSDDAEAVRAFARRMIAAYLNVPAYAAFHEWLGRGEKLRGMWQAWAEGRRREAVAAIPDAVVDELFVHGSPAACRDHIRSYTANGVTTPVVALFPLETPFDEAARVLGRALSGETPAGRWSDAAKTRLAARPD
jgi:probable F420-dependent oxidoreductase